MNLVLQNARVIDPYNNVDEVRDLAVSDGVIVDGGKAVCAQAATVVNLAGCVITPGLIDMHVHFREPGFCYKEDIATGTAAAAAGGFTTVLMMPNTAPALDSVEQIRAVRRRVDETAVIDVRISACLTKNRGGVDLVDIEQIRKQTDIVALTDDGDCIQDTEVMRNAMRRAAAVDLPVVDHCEDREVMSGGVMRRCASSACLDVPGMPGETESRMVARNVALCRETGCHIHIQHISYVASIEHVREAQREGLPVTAEVSPHHLTLTAEDVEVLGTGAKMNPPLGTSEDREALISAVADGTISVIATDHAPHAPKEKARAFVDAPFGVIGLETAIPICLTALYATGRMTLADIITRFTVGPASVLGLECRGIVPGAAADLTILNPDFNGIIDATTSLSKCRNSPFHNRSVSGKIIGTLKDGNWVYRSDSLCGAIGEK